ncbi:MULTISPECIES: LysR family transcriptional regulator [Aneurinibacillus]|uniref:LysR family transcriptional regulator n=1 Tax=Aneurinibacillus thermoaerophilus TaxID=143495 RepID=A0A1G8AK97_ANETH|nr:MULTISPECIES: LysR family transcriptional regulator [Aneurinibacillus]AMA71499.1 LysR family transcriptional regulator [Aneurinibacillus sp. XH2]MED0675322.1 LysR family transcriptional regulator [Aneurinibacillus thermoaerophilus]MED0678614.1 LysR family transcriptional regulator [Aneurinibacillus thermoaerophilus]MED0738297.1 LysR family transcriptional regulator [Aneurinibacillus thermoaerophilus]MED0756568.1 LysR family transcriptional regulator [Aneurinibacillus thermoaerophilus]
MELRQIQYFIEVAKREHVTEAALALHVAQSAVSRQIFNLESELGVDLFIREGRNVRLTPIGRSFLAYMQQAMQVIEKAKREIEEFLDPELGTIRIGFPSSLAAYTLPTVISAFRESHPQVKFQLRQGSYRSLIDAVAKGEIDLALLGPVPKHEKQIQGHILFLENIVALLPAHHPLAGQSSLQLSQLRDDSFVLFPEGFILRELVVNACRQFGFQPKVSFEGEDIDAIKGLVAAGLGVTLIPEITLVDSIPRATVKLPISEPTVTRTVGVIIPSDRELLPTEKRFYEFLKQFFTVLSGFEK